jgi:hypothetical protein
MERQHDEQIRDYRETLLNALRARTGRRSEGQLEVFQVFVDQERVGMLDGNRDDASRISVNRMRAIHTVEVRSEAGDLVGGVCAQEFDRKAAQFRIGRSTLDVSVHNRPDGGMVRVALQAASPAWTRIANRLLAMRQGSIVAAVRVPLWVTVQAALVMAVVFLLTERFTDRWEAHDARLQALSSTTKPVEARLEAKLEQAQLALGRQEQLLDQLARAQEETVQRVKAQQQAFAGLHRTVETVMQHQKQLGVNAKVARRGEKPAGDRTAQAIEDQVNKVLRSMESDRERVFNHIFHLSDAQARITREQGKLQQDIASLKNRELRTSLEQQAIAVAKMMSAEEASKAVTGVESSSALAGGQKQEPKAYLVTFWVSFQEGTPEESIEQLIQGINGRKGPVNAGWYPVEVNLPKPQTSDEMIESLKKAKIVKAITTSLNTVPPPK